MRGGIGLRSEPANVRHWQQKEVCPDTMMPLFEQSHLIYSRSGFCGCNAQLIEPLKIGRDMEVGVELVARRRGENQLLIRDNAECLPQPVNELFDLFPGSSLSSSSSGQIPVRFPTMKGLSYWKAA